MLEVKNLVKIYKTGKEEVRALDDVSINFPENGLVFLLGKSGSGKSTLLNTIGGLDKFDSGEIIVKGKSSKNFSQSDFDSYRNTFIGFIFQEYNILEEFTVSKNIALALELQGKKTTKEAVGALLKQVDMEKFAKRKPNQLSGGQKQRIAIARALIKNPEIIMADEPTGALDSKTGEQVMETLKKLSKDKLIIIVSHDQDFAERYGDRIVELKDGKIISDTTKKEVSPQKTKGGLSVIDGKIVHIKKGQEISQDDLQAICSSIIKHSKVGDTIISLDEKANTDIKKSQFITDDGNREVFLQTTNEDVKMQEYDGAKLKLIKSHLKFKDSFKMGASALKSKVGKLIFTILLSFIAFTIFGVVNTLSAFNRPNSVYETIKTQNETIVALRKEKIITENGYDYSKYLTFSSSEIEALRKKFPQMSFDKIIDSQLEERFYGENDYLYISGLQYDSYVVPYTNEISGITDINSDKLKQLGFSLLAGELPTSDNEICITKNIYDMFALKNDTIKSYQDLITYCDTHNANTNKFSNVKVVGIIDPQIDVSKYLNNSKSNNIGSIIDNQAINTILKSGYLNMIFTTPNKKDEIHATSSLSVTLINGDRSYDKSLTNEDTLHYIYERFKSNNYYSNTADMQSAFVAQTFTYISSKYSSLFEGDQIIELGENEIMCENFVFNNYDTDDLQNMIDSGSLKIKLKVQNENEEEYTVVGLLNNTGLVLNTNKITKIFDAQKDKYDYIIVQLSNNDNENKKFVKFCETLNSSNIKYTIQNESTAILDDFGSTITSVASVFFYIGIGFAIFASLLLMSFIATSISYKRREIGILRALGARGKDVFSIFFNESAIIAIINFVLATIATFVVSAIINWSIINKLGINITLLVVGPAQIGVILGVSLLSAFLASLIPVMKIAHKKPIDAINNR